MVVGGDAIGQLQEGAPPRQFGLAELLDLAPALGPTDDATQGNGNDGEQLVALAVVTTRVSQAGEVVTGWRAGS